MKKSKINNYIAAYEILYGEWKSINSCDYINSENEEEEEISIADTKSMEIQLIKKELWENLSTEAKEIIFSIINSPVELLEYNKNSSKVSLSLVKKYYKELWKSSFIVNHAVNEIKKWIQDWPV